MKRAFIIAMEDEAAAIKPALGADDLLIVCGIGKVNAAAAAQRAIDAGADEILNAGFCGGFEPTMKVGDCFEVDGAVQYDFDLAELNHTDVGVLNERADAVIPTSVTGRFPARRLATGDRFSSDERDHALILRLECALRDMEGAAIAQVCEKARVRCRALKCVTNVAGAGAMVGQFNHNREYAFTCLKNAAISWI